MPRKKDKFEPRLFEQGWLKNRVDDVTREIESWPNWMKKVSGIKCGKYMSLNSREEKVLKLLQEWEDKQGHDRCWYYPELFEKLKKVYKEYIVLNTEPQLPSKKEFKEGCKKYQEEQYP